MTSVRRFTGRQATHASKGMAASRPRLLRICCTVLVASLPIVASCEQPVTPELEPLTVGAPIVTDDVLLFRTETLEDTLGFAGGWGIRRHREGYATINPQLDFISVLDLSLEVQRTVGRTGEGPGELDFPMVLSAIPEEIAVKDGNGRVSLFDSETLEFKRAIPVPYSGGFALVPGERILILSMDTSAVGAVLAKDTFMILEPFPDLPRIAPEEDTRLVARWVSDVDAGLAYVLDELTGAIAAYEVDGGRLEDVMTIPPDIWAPIAAENAAKVEGLAEIGLQALSGSSYAVRGLFRAGRNRLLILSSVEDAYALLVDLQRREVRKVLFPLDAEVVQALRTAYAAVLHGDTLVAMSDMDIAMVRLDLEP